MRWLGNAGIDTALIDPGKPWQNATDESFNGKLRDECLSLQWFRNHMDAKVGIEQWRRHYNEVRPHSSLGYLTPAEFKAQQRADGDDGGRSPTRLAQGQDATAQRPGRAVASDRHAGVLSAADYTGDVDLNAKLAAWENFYNYQRPHGAFEGKTPYEALREKIG